MSVVRGVIRDNFHAPPPMTDAGFGELRAGELDALAGELMPHLKRMFDQFQAQQQRAQLYDAAHV